MRARPLSPFFAGSPFLAGALALLVLSVGPAPAIGADEPPVLRTYAIDALTSALAHEPARVLGLEPPPGMPSLDLAQEDEEPESFIARDPLVELIKATIGPEAWAGDTSVEVGDDGLRVRASPAVQAKVESALANLWADASLRVSLEATWADLPTKAVAALEASGAMVRLRKGRVDSATVEAVLAQAREAGAAATTSAAVARPGVWTCLGQVDVVSYVADYAVEIAQGSRVGNPLVGTAHHGWSVEARARPLRDGSVWVEAFAQRADLEPDMRTRDLEAKPFGSVDLPSAAVVRFTSAARVAAGATWASLARSPDAPDVLHVLLVTPRVTGGGGTPSEVRRFDLGALVRPPVEIALREVELAHGPRSAPLLVALEAAGGLTVDEWLSRLREAVSPEAWDREGSWLNGSGTAIYARAEPEALDRAAQWLAEQEVRRFRGVRLQVRVDRRAASDGGAWSEVGRTSFDVPLGRAVCAEVGVERSYVAEWDVEVAQEIASGDPVVGVAFGGLWMNLRATATPRADAVLLHLDGALRDLQPTFEVRRPNNEYTGIIELPKVRVARESRDVVLENGKPMALDVTGVGDRPLRIEVTAEW